MSIIIAEIITIIVLSALLSKTMKNVKNVYANGSTYQIVVNCFAVTEEFASAAEARAFAHGIAMTKTEEGEQVRIFKVFEIEPHKVVAPIGMKKAFKAGNKEYAKGYNKATLAKKWW